MIQYLKSEKVKIVKMKLNKSDKTNGTKHSNGEHF